MQYSTHNNPEAEFSFALFNHGYGSPDIIADGELHRFRVEGDKSGSKNGWYVLNHGPHGAYGAYGSWKDGVTVKYAQHTDKPLSPFEQRTQHEAIKQAKLKQQLERQSIHEKAAETALAVWQESEPVLLHSYLKAKRVLPFGARQNNGFLIVPLRDTSGKIWTYQYINAKGEKRFLKGGKKKGCFYQMGVINSETKKIYIAEGFATAATVHTKLHHPIIVAFDSNNIKPVALEIRKKYRHVEIVIAADNDINTYGNPGITAAKEAANAVGGSIIFPNFDDEDGEGTDFNDFVNCGGEL